MPTSRCCSLSTDPPDDWDQRYLSLCLSLSPLSLRRYRVNNNFSGRSGKCSPHWPRREESEVVEPWYYFALLMVRGTAIIIFMFVIEPVFLRNNSSGAGPHWPSSHSFTHPLLSSQLVMKSFPRAATQVCGSQPGSSHPSSRQLKYDTPVWPHLAPSSGWPGRCSDQLSPHCLQCLVWPATAGRVMCVVWLLDQWKPSVCVFHVARTGHHQHWQNCLI